ncbi:MAG TPA: alpha/beta fold hydrolase [Candidatus Limnocylindria bacterium]|nr:alpha/beta fold hydrolase [Candidatus Limnocylindria bacterium]
MRPNLIRRLGRLFGASAVLTLGACTTAPAPPGTGSPSVAVEPLRAEFEVRGHDVWVECEGSGQPVILLEAGFGGSNDVWAPIVRPLSDATRVCAYDRVGTGSADRPTEERTLQDVVDDLDALLRAAEIPRPVVLVGHSFGGLTGAVFTAQHPDDVAALVMIDAGHPDAFDRIRAVLPARERELFDRDIRRPNPERIDPERTADDARPWLDRFPAVPLTVIGAARPWTADCAPSTPETCAAVDAVNLELQRDYAALTPDARFVEADTGHFVWQDDPDLVIDEILGALRRARAGPPPGGDG